MMLVGSRCTVGQLCPGSQESKTHPGMHQTWYHQPGKRSDYTTVVSVGAAPDGVLHMVLGPTISEVHEGTRMHPEKGNKTVERARRNVL